MRKICLLVFSLLVFLLSLNILFPSGMATAEDSIASSSSEKQVANVDYRLPYPGLLPDSPLYFLRIIRDKIVEFLISDPFKKSEFDLLQADKRLNAAIYLLNKGKTSLALSTVSKAENYFSQALDKMQEAKMQGINISEMEGNLTNALRKHQQELEYLVAKANVDFKQRFKKELERVGSFKERLRQ